MWPAAAPGPPQTLAVVTTSPDVFAGFLDWGLGQVPATVEDYVTVDYSQDERASFAAAVHAGVARQFMNHVAVVHCEGHTNCDHTVADLLGDEWRARPGPVASARHDFSAAKAYVSAERAFSSETGCGAAGRAGGAATGGAG